MATIISILVIIFFLTVGCNQKLPAEKQNPNFLILIADDAGWENFGCYGDPYIKTPHIDALAESGLKANNAFLTTPQCSPSRISVLTGKYAHATGAEDLHMPLPEGEKILPSFLKENGYFSGLLKKAHLGPHGDNQFDWYSENLDHFETFLDSAATRPFFMWVGFTDPHRPYRQDIIENPQNPDSVLVPPYLLNDMATRKDLADYYNEIRRMDAQIGEYITTLRERDVLAKTMIIFFSDNGAPFPRAKGSLYDAGIKTPLIFSWPGNIEQNTVFNGLLSVIDLAPTILDMTGIEIPEIMQGKSMLNVLKSPQTEVGREYVFSERNWHNIDEHMRSIRSANFKLISNAYFDKPHGTAADISKSPSWQSLYELKQQNKLSTEQALLFQVPRPEFELYKLADDPYEFNNLITNPDYSKIAYDLKRVLKNWRLETGDFTPDQRRRKDNTDRYSGVKFDQTRLPGRID